MFFKRVVKVLCIFLLTSTLNTLTVQAYELPKSGIVEFISNIECEPIEPTIKHDIENHSGKKTFMSYKTITDKTSKQYALQKEAITDEEGFRKIDDRYCVAIGTAFDMYTGQYFDAVLENGEIIECIVGDIKDDRDTDITNVFTPQGCCLEFIVDTKQISDTIRRIGDCSYRCDKWDSPCVQYKFYNTNHLEKGEE